MTDAAPDPPTWRTGDVPGQRDAFVGLLAQALAARAAARAHPHDLTPRAGDTPQPQNAA